MFSVGKNMGSLSLKNNQEALSIPILFIWVAYLAPAKFPLGQVRNFARVPLIGENGFAFFEPREQRTLHCHL